MFTKIYWLHQFENSAKLGIMARPRGNDWLEEEIIHFKKQKVGVIVSLLESDEIYELGLEREEQLCQQNDIRYINLPIPDREIPKTNDTVDKLINELILLINEGKTISIHCRMGIGRSSIIAGAVLLVIGYKASNLIEYIGKIRGVKVPDTEEQVHWLLSRAKNL